MTKNFLCHLIKLLLLLIFTTSCAQVKTTPSYDARLSEYSYPFPVKSYSLKSQTQELAMAFMDLVPKKSTQRTVVLLHGKNFSGFYWKKIAKKLLDKGYRVIIPDQIGFGKSSKPAHYQYSFGQLALNTKKLLDSLSVETFTLVGHSMGGMLAVSFAHLYPKKVNQLVLINPIGLEPYLDYVKFKDPDFFYQLELKKTAKKAIAYQRRNYYDGKWKKEYQELLIPTIGQIAGKDWPLIAWNNALTYGPIFSENILPRIEGLKPKTTLILGTRDKTGPGRGWKKKGVTHKLGQYDRLGKDFKKLLPKTKLIELSGLGHMPHFEDYPRFSKVFYPLFH